MDNISCKLRNLWRHNIPKVLIGQCLLYLVTHLKLTLPSKNFFAIFQILNQLIFDIVKKILYFISNSFGSLIEVLTFCEISF